MQSDGHHSTHNTITLRRPGDYVCHRRAVLPLVILWESRQLNLASDGGQGVG